MNTTLERSTLRFCSLLLVGLGLFGATATSFAGSDSPVDKINAEAARSRVTGARLRGNVSVLAGSGGNIAVLGGKGRKLMVDGGIAVSQQKLATALEKAGPGRVELVINTHWHWDHTDGNQWLHDAGATLLAHGNTLAHLSKTTRVEDWQHTFEPVPSAGRPTLLVDAEKTLDFDGETVVIRYYGPAHTDGDLSVYFQKADVLVTGDTYWNGIYPFIDTVSGGSIDGMIKAANTNIALSTEKTQVVPGHGPVAGRAALIEFRDMLVAIRENVAALKRQGKSLDQVIAARPTAAYDQKWGNFVIDPAFFTRLVYRGV